MTRSTLNYAFNRNARQCPIGRWVEFKTEMRDNSQWR